jgi:hypothetical protein
MSLFERSSTHSAPESSPTQQPDPKSTWLSRKTVSRLAVLTATVATILCVPAGSHVLAKSGQQAKEAASNQASDIDPDAIDAVKKMAAYLHTLKSYQVIDNVTQDDVLDDGLIVQSTSKVDYLLARPNRMRIEVTSDDSHRLYLYDGKNFTVWGRLVNYYATVPAPPTIGELFEKITEKYDIELPLYDLYNWGSKDEDINKIKTAIDIGPSAVEGVTCEHYAFHQEGVDWQIWIQLGEFPLPRKLVITTLTDEARPQHSDTLTWNLAPSFNDGAFAFDPPPDAKRVVLEQQKSDATETGK